MATAAKAGRVAKRAANSEWLDRLARLGFCARGVAYGVIGLIALQVAQANGIDGTRKLIARQTYGSVLLTATALGLLRYGIYSFVEARYRQR